MWLRAPATCRLVACLSSLPHAADQSPLLSCSQGAVVEPAPRSAILPLPPLSVPSPFQLRALIRGGTQVRIAAAAAAFGPPCLNPQGPCWHACSASHTTQRQSNCPPGACTCAGIRSPSTTTSTLTCFSNGSADGRRGRRRRRGQHPPPAVAGMGGRARPGKPPECHFGAGAGTCGS